MTHEIKSLPKEKHEHACFPKTCKKAIKYLRKLLKKEKEVEYLKVINKEIYVKFREPIMVRSKGEENQGRFEPRKFGALRYEEIFQNTALETIRKQTLKPGYRIGGYREQGIDNT